MMMTLQTSHFLLTAFPFSPERPALLSFLDGGSVLSVDASSLLALSDQLRQAGLCVEAAGGAAARLHQEGG